MKYITLLAATCSARWPDDATVTWIPGPHTGGYDPVLTAAEARQKKQTLSFGVPTVHQESQVTAQLGRWPDEPTQAWIDGPRYGGNDKDLNEAEARQKAQHNRFGVPNVVSVNQKEQQQQMAAQLGRWPEEPTVTWIPGPRTGGYDPDLTAAEGRQKAQTNHFGVPTVHQQIDAQVGAWPEQPTQTWINGPGYGGADKELNEAEAKQKAQHNRFGVPNVIGAHQKEQQQQMAAQVGVWPDQPTQTWVNGPGFGGADKDLNEAEARQKAQHNRFGVPSVINGAIQKEKEQ